MSMRLSCAQAGGSFLAVDVPLTASTLDLSENELTALPPEIGRLTRLSQLFLDNNELASLPPELGLLTNLRVLHLECNELASLPAELGRLRNLRELHLHCNRFVDIEMQRLAAATQEERGACGPLIAHLAARLADAPAAAVQGPSAVAAAARAAAQRESALADVASRAAARALCDREDAAAVAASARAAAVEQARRLAELEAEVTAQRTTLRRLVAEAAQAERDRDDRARRAEEVQRVAEAAHASEERARAAADEAERGVAALAGRVAAGRLGALAPAEVRDVLLELGLAPRCAAECERRGVDGRALLRATSDGADALAAIGIAESAERESLLRAVRAVEATGVLRREANPPAAAPVATPAVAAAPAVTPAVPAAAGRRGRRPAPLVLPGGGTSSPPSGSPTGPTGPSPKMPAVTVGVVEASAQSRQQQCEGSPSDLGKGVAFC